MKKSFNKAVSILLVIIMVFSCVPVAMAANFSGSWYTTYPDRITWSYVDGKLTYSGKGAIKDPDLLINTDVYDVVTVELTNSTSIPSYTFFDCTTLETVKFWTDTVTEIGVSAFSGCTSLKSINLPNSITTIENDTFYNCPALKNIKIPSSVTRINSYAFSFAGLTSISIPASVEYIDETAFSTCLSLSRITVDNNNLNYFADGSALFNKDGTRLINYASNSTAKEYTVPDNVNTIGSQSFRYLKNLTEIVLPISVTTIEDSAFFESSSLSKITIPYNVTSIGENLFTYKIGNNLLTYKDNITIYGYSDTYAEKYANENEIDFVSLCTHNYTETITENATCVATGTKTLNCSDCGYEFTETIPVSETHSFTDYLSDNNATCSEDGTKTAKCDNCEATDTITDEGSATGHSFTNYVSDNNATCLVDGTKTAKCNNCEVTEKITDEGSATGHSFTNYVSDNNAKCLEDGTKTAKCDNCEVTDTVLDIDSALEHSYELKNIYKPDCNTDGYGVYVCENCEDSYYDYENYKATNHEDKNGDGICDECTANVEKESGKKDCSCMCHSTGLMKIIYKILRFFWKLFKINKVCGCGIAHY